MINETLNEADSKMDKAVEVTREDFAAIRTGRANPSMFHKLTADYYGAPTPLQQLASFTAPEPRVIIISPYDAERDAAHREGDPRLRPRREPHRRRQDASASRCPSSPRSAARTTSRWPRRKAEDGRVSVRNIRRNAKQALEKLEKDGEVGKDDVTGAEKRLDGMTKKHTDEIDDMLKHKEAELLEV